MCQGREGYMQLQWREWEVMAMMRSTIFMLSTCTTWTGWSIRKWRCLLRCYPYSALVLLFQSTPWSSNRRRRLLDNASSPVLQTLKSPAPWFEYAVCYSDLVAKYSRSAVSRLLKGYLFFSLPDLGLHCVLQEYFKMIWNILLDWDDYNFASLLLSWYSFESWFSETNSCLLLSLFS